MSVWQLVMFLWQLRYLKWETMEPQGLRLTHLHYTHSPWQSLFVELTLLHLSLLPSSILLDFPPSFPSPALFIFPSFSSAQSLCLSDEPRAAKEYRYPEKLPGELYDADTQCKWQFGEKAKLCTLDFKKVEQTEREAESRMACMR